MKGKMTAEELEKTAEHFFESVLLPMPESQNEHDLVDAYNFLKQALTQHKQTIAELEKKYNIMFENAQKNEKMFEDTICEYTDTKAKQEQTISKQAEEIAELKDDYNQLSIMDRGHRDKISKQAEEIERLKKVLNWHSAESE